MIPVLLTKIKTSDGITLDGIYVPPKRKGDTALIWLHGLSSRFSSGQTLIKVLSSACSKNSIGYFKFNNRGHDIVNRDGSGKTKFQGMAFEKFERCILDIRATIGFARKLGYKKILLAGHSTGANKALYYLYKTRDKSIKGLLLLGPISDIDFDLKKFGAKSITRRLALAKKLANKNPLQIMPPSSPQPFGIWTTQRLISILSEGAPEDTFPYYNPNAKWKELNSVHVPIAVVFGSRDEYLTRVAKELVRIFWQNARQTKSFSGIIIKGADHGFRGKEKELTREIIKFIKRAIG